MTALANMMIHTAHTANITGRGADASPTYETPRQISCYVVRVRRDTMGDGGKRLTDEARSQVFSYSELREGARFWEPGIATTDLNEVRLIHMPERYQSTVDGRYLYVATLHEMK